MKMNRKQLRLRISSVISTLKACRPKDSAAASPPVFHVDFPTPPPPPRPSPSRRRAAAAVVAAAGCRSFSPEVPVPARWAAELDTEEDDMSRARETPAYLWRKEEKWHVVNITKEELAIEKRKKIDCDDPEDDDDDLFPSNVKQIAASRSNLCNGSSREIKLRRRRRSQKSFSRRNSTSSIASGSWFSSDDDQENDERSEEADNGDEDDEGDNTDTLLSSRSFSTDSSVAASSRPPRMSGAGAMLSRLMPCGADNNRAKVVKESFAVVKRSEDPRGDFRRSMAEMVVEKGIYDAGDLEQLLNCFLSLNSRHHHRAIVAAFADIWDAVFPAET